MKKFNVVAASAVALSAALASGSALAHGTLAVATANYNAALVTAAGGIITVPWGGTASATYTVTAIGALQTSLEVNSRFTVTLPSGFTFASAPSLTTGGTVLGGSTSSTSLFAGGIGSQTATFVIGAPAPGNVAIPVGGTLALNQVSVQGATALETPGAALNITVQSTNNAEVTNNDVAPVLPTPPGVTFTSDTGALAAFPFTISGVPRYQIDLAPPSLGTEFFIDPPVGVDAPFAPLGVFSLVGTGSLGANGLAATINTTDTATITIAGFFNGIKEAFTTVGNGTPDPLISPIVTVGTATPTSVTYPDVLVTPPGSMLNILATGTTFLQANNSNFTAVYTPGTGVTDFTGGMVTSSGDAIPYTGGTAINVTNFLTGSDAGYASLVRVTNESNMTQTLFAVANPYSGGPQLVGSIGTIGAGTGTVFTETTIGTDIGLVLANSGQRATLTIISVPGVGAGTLITADGLLVNPGGVVVNVN
jgi:hypothetical protein